MKLLWACLALSVLALTQTPAPAAFDAASIRPAAPPAAGHPIINGLRFSPGRLTAGNVPLRLLLQYAYDLKPYQIQGPAWLAQNRFDLSAETQQPLSREQMFHLLQPFLTQQFQLKTHRQTKPVAAYALVAAARGFKMKPADPNSPNPGGFRLSGTSQNLQVTGSVTMDQMAMYLTGQMDRPVLNATNIAGLYDLHVAYAVSDDMHLSTPLSWPGMPPPPPGADPEPTPRAPSIFSALPGQLGLKLESRKTPIEVLVIDSASKIPLGN